MTTVFLRHGGLVQGMLQHSSTQRPLGRAGNSYFIHLVQFELGSGLGIGLGGLGQTCLRVHTQNKDSNTHREREMLVEGVRHTSVFSRF